MTQPDRVRRLRWACRRGMKELDVLLESFIARQEDALGQGRWPEFEALLQEEDDRIWQWVLAPETCREYPDLIDAIVRRA